MPSKSDSHDTCRHIPSQYLEKLARAGEYLDVVIERIVTDRNKLVRITSQGNEPGVH